MNGKQLTKLKNLVERTRRKAALAEKDIFEMISIFNEEMLGNVEGPACTDREICKNNCCAIMIDIPHVLAARYIEESLVEPEGLRRGDTFSWKINVDGKTGRCVFYSPRIHGCVLYDRLDIRPPQCAIYPAGFIEGVKSCKSGAGPWIVKNRETGTLCKQLLDTYTNFCLEEREKVTRAIQKNFNKHLDGQFIASCKKLPPWRITGIRDTWLGFKALAADGVSLSFKRFCNQSCKVPFLECTSPCDSALENFMTFLKLSISLEDLKEEYLLIKMVLSSENNE